MKKQEQSTYRLAIYGRLSPHAGELAADQTSDVNWTDDDELLVNGRELSEDPDDNEGALREDIDNFAGEDLDDFLYFQGGRDDYDKRFNLTLLKYIYDNFEDEIQDIEYQTGYCID